MTTSADLYLTATGSFGPIGDALFMTGDLQSAGGATFSSFVQIQHNGTEQGYNTDAAPQYDEKGAQPHNHSVLLAEVPIVYGDGSNGTVAGVAYREFLLNLNEIAGTRQLLSLDKLQIWQQEFAGLTDFTPDAGFTGSVTNRLAYDLDAGGDRWIALSDGLPHGSGQSDYRILVPDSFFINDGAHRYLTLFSQFGAQGSGWSSDGGFEEWGLHGPSGGTVSALALAASAHLGDGITHRAGEAVFYQFTVSNTGNTAQTGVTLTASLLTDLARDYDRYGNGDVVLDPGEIWSFYGYHTVTQAEIDANGRGDGVLANTATVRSDQVAPVSATANVLVEQNPHVALVHQATVAQGRADAAGDVISYAIAVANDGNMTLAHPTVSDTLAGNLHGVDADADGFNDGDANHDGKLSVGETWQYAASHTVTQEEIDSNGGGTGTIANVATVRSDQVAPVSAAAVVAVAQHPHVTLVQQATVPDGTADAAGDLIGYAIAVTNDGNTTLTGATVSGTLAGHAHDIDADADGFNDGDANHDGKLSVGETWQFTASHAVTQAEMDAGGSIVDTASAATDQGVSASGGAAVAVAQHAHLTLVKSGVWEDGSGREIGFAEAGELIHYTYALTNDGNVTLADVRVAEPGLDGPPVLASGDGHGNALLDVGETWLFQHDYKISRDEAEAGSVASEADAWALGPQNRFVLAHTTAVVALPQAPAMTLDISGGAAGTQWVDANGNGIADADGDFVQFSVLLRNVGRVTLTDLAVSDLLGDAVAANLQPPVPASLTPANSADDTWRSTFSHVLTADDIAAGHVFEELTVTALDWLGQTRTVAAHWDQLLPV